jgi:hypothetical protein
MVLPTLQKQALAGLLLAVLTACSTVAPKYVPTPDNVNRLRDAGADSVKVGDFQADPASKGAVNQLSIRGGSYVSPYDGSFVNYLKEAIRQELDDARLLNPNATVEIGGVLVRNEVNAAGVSTADAQIEARITVKRNGQVNYDKVKSAKHEWESSFFGNLAIPRAQENYPVVVQKLLASLYADPEFIAAIKK